MDPVVSGRGTLEDFSPWLKKQEALGLAIFLGVWLVAMLCCLPSTPLWLLGGFCFRNRFLVGLGINVAGGWLSAMVCFGLARALSLACDDQGCCGSAGRSRVMVILQDMVSRNPYKATLLSRIAYAPMAVKNYGFGAFLHDVPALSFAVCALVGDFPNVLLFTHLGGTVSDIADALDGKKPLGDAPKVGLAISLAVTVTCLVLLGGIARREMRAAERISFGVDSHL